MAGRPPFSFASAETAHIKVVLITARAQEDDIARGASVGADAYLTKPFDPGEMIRVIRKLLVPRPPARSDVGATRGDTVITLDLRHAIARAVRDLGQPPDGPVRDPVPHLPPELRPDPKLRPGPAPGTYATSIAFGLAAIFRTTPAQVATRITRRLAATDWIAEAVTGGGYVTVTVTSEALASVATRITAAGRPASAARCCVASRSRGRSRPLWKPRRPGKKVGRGWRRVYRATRRGGGRDDPAHRNGTASGGTQRSGTADGRTRGGPARGGTKRSGTADDRTRGGCPKRPGGGCRQWARTEAFG